MTDLYDEWWTQRSGIEKACEFGGDVLITGLGLGLVAEAILRGPWSPVRQVTIVEQSPDVIQLVAPYLRSRYPGKIEVIEADAFTWQPPTNRRFTVGWHDIWPDPYLPQIPDEMKRLSGRYQPWCDWQGFWPEAYRQALGADRILPTP